MSTLLQTIEKETGANPSVAIIWMHGLGADANDFAPMPQELDLRFSAGTVYDVRSHRESEVMAAVNSLLGVPGSAIGTVSGIFTVNVHHDGEGKANGGSKDPGNGNNPREKE
jgi:hypothetical protein